MAKENNFTKAVKELLGEKEPSDYEKDYPTEQETAMPRGQRVVSVSSKEEDSYVNVPLYNQSNSTGSTSVNNQTSSYSARPKSAPAVNSNSNTSYSTPKASPPPPPPPPPRPRNTPHPPPPPQNNSTTSIVPVTKVESTFINSDTIITGNISSKTDIRNDGKVTGDIFTEENVCIKGNVDGNVEGKSIQVIGGYVVGNITAKVDIINDYESIIIGDITGENFMSDGKVKGNLKVTNSVSLKSNAVIAGNVSARNINVQDGAIIKGNVQIISNAKINEDEVFSVPKHRQMGHNDMFDMPGAPTARVISSDDVNTTPITVEIFDEDET